MNEFDIRLKKLPLGSFYAYFNNKKYLVNKEVYSNGKIIKIFAKELAGNDIVSGNYFKTIKKGLLKPCEMSERKVINFVKYLEIR